MRTCVSMRVYAGLCGAYLQIVEMEGDWHDCRRTKRGQVTIIITELVMQVTDTDTARDVREYHENDSCILNFNRYLIPSKLAVNLSLPIGIFMKREVNKLEVN